MWKECGFVLFLLVGSSALLLTNLDNSYLWQDEASTACIARTILTQGIPMGRDDKNSFSHEHGRDMTPSGIYIWQPWVQFYVAAASFALLGESAVTARLPFALFGIATIVFTYFLGKELWKNRVMAGAGACVLMLSVPFLLLALQCRYYSVAAFFTVLALWAYLRLLQDCKSATTTFVIAAILLLQTVSPAFGLALFPALAIHAAIWHRPKLKSVLLLCALVALANLPWLIWMGGGSYRGAGLGSSLWHAYLLLLQFFWWAPHPMFAIAVIVLAVARRRHSRAGNPLKAWPWQRASLLPLFIGITLAAAGFAAHRAYFRYLTPLLPLASLVAGRILVESWQLNKRVWTTVVVLGWLLTGLFPQYLYELTHEYKGPIRGIVTYLNNHAHPDDIVAINYSDLPVKFHTKLRVVGGYTGEDLAPITSADWVIPRNCGNDELLDYMIKNVPWDRYEKIVLEGYPDVCFENRESPRQHHFWTATRADPVVIYRRIP
jgi:4-amino-4-deoxy-L-arabinose transferase-like glycosyltransferase